MKASMVAATLAAASLCAPALAQEFAEAGSRHPLGESVTVPHLVPNGPEVPIELTVTAIEEGSMDDLQGFEIPDELRNARPVYVRYEYENVGDEDLSNQQIGAFIAVDDRDQAHSPALAMNGGSSSFTACPAGAPGDMTPGKSAEGCVMFMLHEDAQVAAAGYRGHYRHETGADTQKDFPIYYDPILWTAGETASSPQPAGGRIVQ